MGLSGIARFPGQDLRGNGSYEAEESGRDGSIVILILIFYCWRGGEADVVMTIYSKNFVKQICRSQSSVSKTGLRGRRSAPAVVGDAMLPL